jgi:hypothetical protein
VTVSGSAGPVSLVISDPNAKLVVASGAYLMPTDISVAAAAEIDINGGFLGLGNVGNDTIASTTINLAQGTSGQAGKLVGYKGVLTLANSVVVNASNGEIDATGSVQTSAAISITNSLSFNAAAIANAGDIVCNGALSIAGAFANNGTIEGSLIALRFSGGAFTNGALGLIESTGGTSSAIQGSASFDNEGQIVAANGGALQLSVSGVNNGSISATGKGWLKFNSGSMTGTG